MAEERTIRVLKRFYFYSLFVTCSVSYSQTRIDTLYSEPALDGSLTFFERDSFIYVNTTEGVFAAGDAVSATGLGPNYERGYLSFDLTELPGGISIDSARLNVYQSGSVGDGHGGWYPKWQLPGGDTMFCIVDHVSYGDTLDTLDWTAGDANDPETMSSSIGILSRDSLNGYKTMDVTEVVRADIRVGRKRTQFRVRFPVDTDHDDLDDGLQFDNGEYRIWGYPQIAPKVVIKSTLTSVNVVQLTSIMDIEAQSFPNPFNSSTVILYAIPQKGRVDIDVYSSVGQLIQRLLSATQETGRYSIEFEGRNLPSGVYFIVVKLGSLQKTIRVSLIK